MSSVLRLLILEFLFLVCVWGGGGSLWVLGKWQDISLEPQGPHFYNERLGFSDFWGPTPFYHRLCYTNGSQSVFLEPVASASPRNLLEMQTLWPSESEILEWGQQSVLTSPAGDPDTCSGWGHTPPDNNGLELRTGQPLIVTLGPQADILVFQQLPRRPWGLTCLGNALFLKVEAFSPWTWWRVFRIWAG